MKLLLENAKSLIEKEVSLRDKLKKKFGITKFGPGSTGLNEEKGIYYGWSHRAIQGFKVGDMLFDETFGRDLEEAELDKMPFVKRGSKKIKNLEDAKQAAINFSDYVS